ncbi:unnamed protein product [Sphenostylis stenocarpa]|uniref:Uncharacterized protein n=1 Tax=Sphenostylis stenocarpa TaxID=92480 RepID=A0AA86VIR4_9FABA|nr:unnamed protein product [Sphenostylis stenocarpa]
MFVNYTEPIVRCATRSLLPVRRKNTELDTGFGAKRHSSLTSKGILSEGRVFNNIIQWNEIWRTSGITLVVDTIDAHFWGSDRSPN